MGCDPVQPVASVEDYELFFSLVAFGADRLAESECHGVVLFPAFSAEEGSVHPAP